MKNGAQPRQLIEFGDLGVGSIENPHGAHGCPCTKWVLDSSWTPRARNLTGQARKCLKRFGGPEGIRTLDLFHAMEARAQLPTASSEGTPSVVDFGLG